MSFSISLAVLVLTLSPVQDDPPNRKQQEQIARELLALDPYSEEGHTTRKQLLEKLQGVPFPKRSDLRRWDKFFSKERKALPTLPQEAGEHFDLEGSKGRYFLAGNLKRPKGIFIGLHGGGVDSGDAGSSHGAYKGAISERDWLGIFPEVLEKTELGWTTSGTEEWVMSLLNRALNTWDIDPNRVFLGGHSMGGYGSWVLGAAHADRFAALLPSAGAPSFVVNRTRGTVQVQRGVVPNLRNTPMCVFQSTDDPKVGPEANQAAVQEVEAAQKRWGGYEDFDYWQVSDRGHGYPEGGVEVLVSRIQGFERKPFPSKLIWQPRIAWSESFYWLHWEGGPKVGATVIAEIKPERNTVDVRLERTQGDGLALLLTPELVDFERELTVFVNGARVFKQVPKRDFGTWLWGRCQGDPGRYYEGVIALGPPTTR